VFRNSGITRGLLQIAGEGVEEAGQGISGTMNRNVAVEEYAQIGRGVLEGTGEEAAIGALAGMGTAGAAAVPATARGAVVGTVRGARNAANALFSETTYSDPLRQDILGGSRAGRATEAAANLLKETGVTDAAQKAGATAKQVTGPVLEIVEDFNNRDERAQTKTEIEAGVDAARIVDEGIAKDEVAPEVVNRLTNEETVPSEGLADTRGSNVVSTTANIMAKISSRKFKPTAEDKAYAAAQIMTLKGVINSLPAQAKRQAMKMVASTSAKKVQEEATKLDLNKETVTPEQEVATTINVAKTNPANVNPTRTKKILEESGENISPENQRYLRIASRIAEKINNAVGQIITLRQEENIGLNKVKKAEKEIVSVRSMILQPILSKELSLLTERSSTKRTKLYLWLVLQSNLQCSWNI
jgi:hypothetical protein